MKQYVIRFLAALLLLLAGCQAGSEMESGDNAELAEESRFVMATQLTENTGVSEEIEPTEAKVIREMGEDLFQFLFSLRSGEAWQGDFVVTNEEGQVLQAIDGKPYGTMDANIFGDMATTKNSVLRCVLPCTNSFVLEVEEYACDDNNLNLYVNYWHCGTAPNISGGNIRQIAISKDEIRVQGDNMQDYLVDVTNTQAEVSSYEEIPSLWVTGTDESEVWLTGLTEKNQVEIHTETSGYTVRIVLNKGPEQVALEQTFQPGQVAVVNYNPGEFSITLKEP